MIMTTEPEKKQPLTPEQLSQIQEDKELLEKLRKWRGAGLPVQLARPQGRPERARIDNEFLKGGYQARFRDYHLLEILAVLCMHARASTQICFPSYGLILKLTGYKKRNIVSNALKILEALNIIFVEHGGGRRRKNRYLLLKTELWKPADSISAVTNGSGVVELGFHLVANSNQKEETVTEVAKKGNAEGTGNQSI